MTSEPRSGIDIDYEADDLGNQARAERYDPARAGHEERPTAESALHQEPSGPTGRAPATESTGDPDRVTVESGGQAGAGAGAVAGLAVAGPVGAALGAAVGGVAGSVAEAADVDTETNEDRPLARPGSEGTGPVDPATDYVRD